MFSPTREQVRSFFYDVWQKYRDKRPLAGLENVALDVMLLHPEYHAQLGDRAQGDRDYTPEDGASNPFLHLSLHVAVEEQLSIDQPPGIRREFERLAARTGDRHEALHAVLDCLGETVWRAQREGGTPDAEAYLECVRKK
jgi:hypothetical protein